MGSFSWLKADDLTNVRNVANGFEFKFLIPKQFGGGFIQEEYQDYGYLGTKQDGTPKHDMYELLAIWNCWPHKYSDLKLECTPPDFMKEIDQYTDHNRCVGIDIGCYADQIDQLQFPLKLVSVEFEGTYEDLNTPSYGDSDQGFHPTSRDGRPLRYLCGDYEYDDDEYDDDE